MNLEFMTFIISFAQSQNMFSLSEKNNDTKLATF